MQKLRIGVLMGGKSIEHEVSFNSGRTICDHLDTQQYHIIPLYQTLEGYIFILPWHFLHRGKTTDFTERLAQEAQLVDYDQLKELVDFIYLALHGSYGEDGSIQGFLEILGIPYCGPKVFSSALCMNKIMQKAILESHGITTPASIIVYPYEIEQLDHYRSSIQEKLNQADISFPYFVKPYHEGSSLGVSIIFNNDQLADALHKASTIDPRKKQPVLIEKKVEGMEFCCIIIPDVTQEFLTMPLTEIVLEKDTHFFDYEQKYMPGKGIQITPARCSNQETIKIQETCLTAMKALDAHLARIDGFLTPEGTIVILEINTLTGMGPSSFLFRQAAQSGMGHSKLINHLISTELHSYGHIALSLNQERHTDMEQANKMRVAILLGGNTNEKEVSFDSGRNVTYKLSPQKYTPIPIFVNKNLDLYMITDQQLVSHATHEIETSLRPEQKIKWSDLPTIADFVFIALHGGVGENGCVQGTLHMLGLPYNGSSILTSALCMNKYKTNTFLKSKGFDVPRSYTINRDQWIGNPEHIIQTIKETIGFPCIIKPHDDGCSVGVFKVHDESDLHKKFAAFFALGKQDMLIEECIQGMELTVGVIGNYQVRALPPSRTVSMSEVLSMQEKFLPGAGENQTPAPLAPAALSYVQRIMEQVYKEIGCKGYVRIDCFYQSAQESPTGAQRVIILEINSLPALTPATCLFHQAAECGIKPMDFIDMIIELGIQEHSQTSAAYEQKIMARYSS